MGPLLTAGSSVLQALIVLATICVPQPLAEKTGKADWFFTNAALRWRNGLPMMGGLPHLACTKAICSEVAPNKKAPEGLVMGCAAVA